MQKLITFAVPCYNSAAYMRHCVDTLLTAGERAEIILVDDGSVKDETPAICDEYAEKYPTIVRAIHQENGGHGEGVNQGLRNANGLYYKVVDSDDWLDTDALAKVLDKLQEFVDSGVQLDLMLCNYVYEHVEDNTQHTVRYTNIFPQDRVFTWKHTRPFRPDQNILMHSVIYRTQVLRDCGIVLPKHTFYVDNIFVYQPLPYVNTMYYMNLDLYRYFIGRSDQSVNEKVMVGRVDQQLRVTRHMIDCQNLNELPINKKKLRGYMLNYLSMMMAISSILLILDGSEEAHVKKFEIWKYLYNHVDRDVYRRIRYLSVGGFTNLKGKLGDKISLGGYRMAQKIFKFN
ncbi:MAG: glycosyltransferase family 2 protein [Faecalibacterium sp.]|nr:glycosyltransferase family 2 protein [Faecalibacterium sp.]